MRTYLILLIFFLFHKDAGAQGRVWSQVNPSPTGVDLNGVWGSAKDDVYAVGDFGTILHTSDGRAWETLSSGTSNGLGAIWGASANNVYAAGVGGLILRSTDRGKTWSALESGVKSTFRSLWASGDDVYVTADDVFLYSSDQGKTWSPLTVALGATTFKKVWGVSLNDVYVISWSGDVFRSVDRGKSWSRVLARGKKERPIVMIGGSAKKLYACEDFGGCYYSSNSGETWSQRDIPSSQTLVALWSNPKGEATVVGWSGQIFQTKTQGKTWLEHTTKRAGYGSFYSVWGLIRPSLQWVNMGPSQAR